MNRNLSIGIIVIACILVGLWAAWKWLPQKEVLNEQTTETPQSTPYALFMEKHNGTTVDAEKGSIVVIQLPKETYREPVTVVDLAGKAIQSTTEIYEQYFVISFALPDASEVRVQAASAEKSDAYTLTVKALQ